MKSTQPVIEAFTNRFGREPEHVCAAPGRINLIGEHVDYNLGIVMPMAIERYIWIAVSSLESNQESEIVSTKFDLGITIDMQKPMESGEPFWGNYIRGMISGYRQLGATVPAFQMVVHSTIPAGGGLSSSAALSVATSFALEALCGHKVDPLDKARLAQQTEHEFAGVPCGIMDPFASVFCSQDHLLCLDCKDLTYHHVPLNSPDVAILVVNSGVSHDLGTSEYAVRRQTCESACAKLKVDALRDVSIDGLFSQRQLLDDTEFRRARHVVSEICRAQQFAEQIALQNWSTAGQLMYGSHDSLRDDYDVSCKEIDDLVAMAKELGQSGGVYGSRITGGGFGGCTVSLVKTGRTEEILKSLQNGFEDRYGRKLSGFVSRPGCGASILRAT